MQVPKRSERKTIRLRPWELREIERAADGRETFSEFVRGAALRRARRMRSSGNGHAEDGDAAAS